LYILTNTIENIFASLCEFFSCSTIELETFSSSLYDGCVEGSIIHGDRVKLKVQEFILSYAKSHIDEICMHHLSRRLNGYNHENEAVSNLHELLLAKSSISDFLNSFAINFSKENGLIRMFYRGSEVIVGSGAQASTRIKLRLGQFGKDTNDHCINGFAFADKFKDTGYFYNLSRGPEILTDIAEILSIPDLVETYVANSTYYLYTFLLPIKMPIMNNIGEATNLDKELLLLSECFVRLNTYFNQNGDEYDHPDDIVMRLVDDMSLEPEHFLCRTPI